MVPCSSIDPRHLQQHRSYALHLYDNSSNSSRLMPLHLGQLGEPAAELSETLTPYTTFIVLKFLTNTPSLPSQSTFTIDNRMNL